MWLAAVLVPGIAAIWILAASIGRAATLNALLDKSGAREAGRPRPAAASVRSLLGLNFLRAAATLAAIIGYGGTVAVAALALPAEPQYAGVAVLVWLFLAAAVAVGWTVVNWFLSLAAIFVVKEGKSTFDAVRASVELLRRKPRGYVATASWFGFFRSMALVAAIVLSLLAAGAPNGVVAAVIVAAVALAYFAAVDWMYVARLAAFLQLAEPEVSGPAPLPPSPECLGAGEGAGTQVMN